MVDNNHCALQVYNILTHSEPALFFYDHFTHTSRRLDSVLTHKQAIETDSSVVVTELGMLKKSYTYGGKWLNETSFSS
jgi:hypothetical protein